MQAIFRTILGDDPNTMEDDHPAEIRDDIDIIGVTHAHLPGLGDVLYHREQDRAIFTQGPGTERNVDVVKAENGDIEITILKNGRGQRRMVVVLKTDD